jgi:hypothetical protein
MKTKVGGISITKKLFFSQRKRLPKPRASTVYLIYEINWWHQRDEIVILLIPFCVHNFSVDPT